MFLYPDLYLTNITKITPELLEKYSIKGLILDVDNTLIDFDKNIPNEIPIWCENLKKANIKMCIVSNTNKIKKVEKVAKKLNLEYIYFAHKPSRKGLLKGKDLLNLSANNIAVVGDQILTDVWGR